MSTIIKFDIKELKRLSHDKKSCIVEKKVTQNLALQPWCLGNLKEAVKNLLDYKIGKFDKEFNGILLSYKNLRILQNIGVIRNDNSDIHFQVQADYFIFRPNVGATLKGIVNKKSPTHLGILVHRVFNVVVPRPTEQPGSKWIGEKIKEGQEVTFRIVVLDLFGALPYIRGEIDEDSMKPGPDGDEEVSETKPIQQLNVSYVNFDKTKPAFQKNNGDGPIPPEAPCNNLLKCGKNCLKNNTDNRQSNGKLNSSKTLHDENDGNVSEKNKNKKLKTEPKVDAKQTDQCQRLSKKQKKEIN